MFGRSILRAVASVVSAVMLVAAMAAPAAGGPPEGFTVCHAAPGNPDNVRTLSLGAGALAAHLKHGDTLGPCPG